MRRLKSTVNRALVFFQEATSLRLGEGGMCSSRLIFRENYVQPPDCIEAREVGTLENSVWSSSQYFPVIKTKIVDLIFNRQVLVAEWIARWTSNPGAAGSNPAEDGKFCSLRVYLKQVSLRIGFF